MDSTEEDLVRPIYKNGRYQNPFDTWEDTPGFGTFVKLMRCEDHSNIPCQRVCQFDKNFFKSISVLFNAIGIGYTF